MSIKPNTKYRPTLTTLQIMTILELAKTPPISPEKMSIISTLAPILAKIQTGALKPSYTTQDKVVKTTTDLLAELGGLDEGDPNPASNLGFSKAHYWEQCYTKHKEDPDSCTSSELEGVKEYRYLNGLMSPEEQAAMEGINNL